MKFLTKENVLITSIIGTFFVFLTLLGLFPIWLEITIIFPLILFFSLLTYRMRDEVFEHWVRFAVWVIPVAIIVYALMQAINVFERIFEFPMIILIYVYGLFITISLWRIVSKWRELKSKV